MEDETGGLLFSSSVSNIPQQFSISTVSLPTTSDEEGTENQIDKVTAAAANNLLQNGILVETNKGVVCYSLKDVLTTGVGGLNLSVEDFQNVATQLLTQQCFEKGASSSLTLGDVSQVLRKEVDGEGGNLVEVVESSNLEEEVTFTDSKDSVKTVIINDIKKEPTVNLIAPIPEHPKPAATTEQAGVVTSSQQQKRRGGWPKGRKRKPEPTEIRPPKAPATGYVIYLNEKRKQYKDMPFPEVTKLLGNEWSKLSLEDKRVYLERAELEKKRYREELKAYRQSDAYQAYLTRKRTKNLVGNGTEESDMDATDEIEDEDNEELYCRTCDQWFSSLHNKREHLYGRQHLQSVADALVLSNGLHSTSTSLDESSLDGTPTGQSMKGAGRSKQQESYCAAGPSNVTDAITSLLETTAEREREIKELTARLVHVRATHSSLKDELRRLKTRQSKLRNGLASGKVVEGVVEQLIYNLWAVPSMFFLNSNIEQEADNMPVLLCLTDNS